MRYSHTAEYRAQTAAKKRERYQQRKLTGKCVDCSAGLQEDDGLRCVECEDKARASKKRYIRQAHIRKRENKRNSKRRTRLRTAGRCIACGDPLSAKSKIYCEAHLALRRTYQSNYARRKRAGQPLRESIPRAAFRTKRFKETYIPIDELEKAPRVRIVRALAAADWATFEDLRVLLNLENDSLDCDACAQMVSRLVKACVIERRKVASWSMRGAAHSEYRLSDKGREELARYRSGDLVRKQKRAA